MRRLLSTLGTAALLAGAGLVGAAPAHAAGCTGSSGVTVVVDYGGSTDVRCASGNPGTAGAALTSAGFSVDQVQRQPGAICRINSAPDVACVNMPPTSQYWAVFHASPGGSWTYASKGAWSLAAAPGSVVGFRLGSGQSPSIAPPKPAAPTTTSRPSPTPTATATRTTSARPGAGATSSAAPGAAPTSGARSSGSAAAAPGSTSGARTSPSGTPTTSTTQGGGATKDDKARATQDSKAKATKDAKDKDKKKDATTSSSSTTSSATSTGAPSASTDATAGASTGSASEGGSGGGSLLPVAVGGGLLLALGGGALAVARRRGD
ncbi:hypothetical protein [Janibacter anophelis]|uniref:hypothetical protein n=1 Tax=Janibacter anophelis TaxID=319054 RepID=UPI000DEFC269|nr:hypothetical protein [Janibacter anophelis]